MITTRLLLPALLAALVVSGSLCSRPDTSAGSGEQAAANEELDFLPEPTCETWSFVPESTLESETTGIRIATFNANFLFDGYDPEYRADFPWKADPRAARAHRNTIARVIRNVNADMLIIPETEHLGVLEMIIEESLVGMGYAPYLIDGGDTFTGQDVGLLSRIPIDEIGRVDERLPIGDAGQTYGVTKNFWAHVTIAGLPSTIIGVHFLARPTDTGRRARREIQAEVIRRFVEREVESGRAVIVLGDLNDFDPDIPDVNGSLPITSVLEQIKAAGPGTDDDLLNVLADVPELERFTAFYDKDDDGCFSPDEFTAIDHILLSPALSQMVVDVQYVHVFAAVEENDPLRASDHFPVVVTLSENRVSP